MKRFLRFGLLVLGLSILLPAKISSAEWVNIFDAVGPEQSAIFMFNRGTDAQAVGGWKVAIENYSEAIQLNPNYFEAYLRRAYVFIQTGQYKAAVDDLNRALKISPSNTDVKSALEELLTRLKSNQSNRFQLVNTDKNGYKTYIDTNMIFSLELKGADNAFSVRILGFRPDGSKILDDVHTFKVQDNKLYMTALNIPWTVVNETDYAYKTVEGVVKYLRE